VDGHLSGQKLVEFDGCEKLGEERNLGLISVMAAEAAIHVSRQMWDRRPKQPCVYLLASGQNGVLYAGVTSDLAQRVSLHRQKLVEGFTQRYDVTQLV